MNKSFEKNVGVLENEEKRGLVKVHLQEKLKIVQIFIPCSIIHLQKGKN